MTTTSAPPLQVGVDGRSMLLQPGVETWVGSAPQSHLRLVDPRVAPWHAVIHVADGVWRIEDRVGTCPLFVGPQPQRRVDVLADLVVHLGAPDGPALELRLPTPGTWPTVATPVLQPTPRTLPAPGAGAFPGQPPAQAAGAQQGSWPAPAAVHDVATRTLRIGRAPDNEIPLPDLLVSRHHATLLSGPAGAELTDLGSSNGTFVNGVRVQRARVVAGDVVTIGRHTLRYDGTSLLEYVDGGNVTFGARGIGVVVGKGIRLVNDVSFDLGPRTLMAVVGPSGAGKSTLLGALTGLRPAEEGQVLYGGRDLYANYDELRQRIGFVPQQDILHAELTLRQALAYGARLRFPADVAAADRAARVDEVMAELSLSESAGTRISSLSGGQRKRASTALELLTKPSLLFLDEPTSGLDTDLDRDVMNRLRTLADEGRTVVVVTHNLEHVSSCDLLLVLAKGGFVAYLGHPDGAFAYFGVTNWADLYGKLKTQQGPAWAAEFAASPGRDTHAAPPPPPVPPQTVTAAAGARKKTGTTSFGVQWVTLTRRYVAVTMADRLLLAILALLPIVLAGIARIVPASYGLGPGTLPSGDPGNTAARTLLLVLVVGAALMGSAGAVREIVKERAIYQRERAVGLSSYAYLASKFTVLATVGVVQALVLTLVALTGRPGPAAAAALGSPTVELVVSLALLTVVSVAIGLVISALVSQESQAMPLLVLVTMAELVLCGGLFTVVGRAGLEQVSWFIPARWGFGAVAATTDLTGIEPPNPSSQVWIHSSGFWGGEVLKLALLGLLVVGVLVLIFRRMDRRR